MRKTKLSTILLLIIGYISMYNSAKAQITYDTPITIKLKSKQKFKGFLYKYATDSITIAQPTYRTSTFSQKYDFMSFSKNDISNIDGLPIIGKKNNHESVPLASPTAFSSPAGKHYYRNIYLLGHYFNFGVTNNFDVEFATELASLIFDEDGFLILLGLKYGLPISEFIHVGIAPRYIRAGNESILMLNFPFTIGNRNNFFTISPLLYTDFNSQWFGIGGNFNFRFSNALSLVTDYTLIDSEFVISPNLKIDFSRRFSIFFGAITVVSDNSVPLLGLNYNFQSR